MTQGIYRNTNANHSFFSKASIADQLYAITSAALATIILIGYTFISAKVLGGLTVALGISRFTLLTYSNNLKKDDPGLIPKSSTLMKLEGATSVLFIFFGFNTMNGTINPIQLSHYVFTIFMLRMVIDFYRN